MMKRKQYILFPPNPFVYVFNNISLSLSHSSFHLKWQYITLPVYIWMYRHTVFFFFCPFHFNRESQRWMKTFNLFPLIVVHLRELELHFWDSSQNIDMQFSTQQASGSQRHCSHWETNLGHFPLRGVSMVQQWLWCHGQPRAITALQAPRAVHIPGTTVIAALREPRIWYTFLEGSRWTPAGYDQSTLPFSHRGVCGLPQPCKRTVWPPRYMYQFLVAHTPPSLQWNRDPGADLCACGAAIRHCQGTPPNSSPCPWKHLWS